MEDGRDGCTAASTYSDPSYQDHIRQLEKDFDHIPYGFIPDYQPEGGVYANGISFGPFNCPSPPPPPRFGYYGGRVRTFPTSTQTRTHADVVDLCPAGGGESTGGGHVICMYVCVYIIHIFIYINIYYLSLYTYISIYLYMSISISISISISYHCLPTPRGGGAGNFPR